MTDRPVRLSWRDRDETARAAGRAHDGHVLLPSCRRAAALAVWILDHYADRFELSFDFSPPAPIAAATPTPEAPVGWIAVLGFLRSALGFLSRHRALLVGATAALVLFVLAVLAIALPTAHLRATPVVLLMAGSLLVGYALDHTQARP